ncbi:molecular chaperone GroEL [Micromonospora globbae]|jgi:chaperonin GroEL|uniref:60 kDa chaperonin n=1 Tax=Micromonospora globbae TaxID=1894969 RepID=A0ABZ1SCY5_9ACTN|nr:molecular chaperone GroEL [Micromonospora globbae]
MPEILFAESARRRLRAGVDALAEAAAVTLGPRGRTVVLARPAGPPRVTSDGAEVAAALTLDDPYADLGRRLVREAAEVTRREAGGGGTTAVVLVQAMARHGLRAVAAGASPVAVRRGMDAAVDAVRAHLRREARPVAGFADLAAVATTAAGDREVGELVAAAWEKVGPDGVVTVEEWDATGTEADLLDGMRLPGGYLSPYMVTDPQRTVAVLDDPYVLAHDGRIGAVAEFLPLLRQVVATGRPLLVIAEDVVDDALATLLLNNVEDSFRSVAVRATELGETRRETLRDVAALTGGELVTPEAGLRLADVGLGMLGEARRVVVTRTDTTIVGGAGTEAARHRRVAGIRAQLAAATSDWERERHRLRIARLSGGVCVLRVGGHTEVERRARGQRVAEAVAAARGAARDGVVAGGGSALVKARAVLAALPASGDERAGVEVVRHALGEPLRRIAANGGADGASVAERVADLPGHVGYDARTGDYRDLLGEGVGDPVGVVLRALEAAASVTGMLLTTEAAVTGTVSSRVVDFHVGHRHGEDGHHHPH